MFDHLRSQALAPGEDSRTSACVPLRAGRRGPASGPVTTRENLPVARALGAIQPGQQPRERPPAHTSSQMCCAGTQKGTKAWMAACDLHRLHAQTRGGPGSRPDFRVHIHSAQTGTHRCTKGRTAAAGQAELARLPALL